MSIANNKMSAAAVNNKRSNPYINTGDDDNMPARKQKINITEHSNHFKQKKISPKSIFGPKVIVKSPKNIESLFSPKSIDSSPDIEFDQESSELSVSSEKNSPEKSFLGNISFNFATLFCLKYKISDYLDNLITKFANSSREDGGDPRFSYPGFNCSTKGRMTFSRKSDSV